MSLFVCLVIVLSQVHEELAWYFYKEFIVYNQAIRESYVAACIEAIEACDIDEQIIIRPRGLMVVGDEIEAPSKAPLWVKARWAFLASSVLKTSRTLKTPFSLHPVQRTNYTLKNIRAKSGT
ncbi:hypothetical protein [Pseudomonas sp. FSL W5-0299]|uniref:hypothetical protein n=1 Tax=Pseudomonas sp. FSL W5-0299 TaxID=1917484 RepID=UPI001EE7EA59|nr:hypothetical protein [Pseudomonas sp. FSL W5-0299]